MRIPIITWGLREFLESALKEQTVTEDEEEHSFRLWKTAGVHFTVVEQIMRYLQRTGEEVFV